MARDEKIITETTRHVDAEGNETIDEVSKLIKKKDPEPDYIKLYTQTWCEFNEIPVACRPLFLELATRMSYANGADDEGGQLIYTGKPISDSIQNKLKIKRNRYSKLIAQLVECNALRKINRGVYQINPSYAGRGEWHYNPSKEQGGIENIIAKFNYKDKTVDTEIVWADSGEDTPMNMTYRQGMGARKEDHTTLTETTIANKDEDDIPGQMAITDTDMHTGTED